MRIVQINTTSTRGSTGNICLSIRHLLDEAGVENFICSFSDHSDADRTIPCASPLYLKSQALRARIRGNWGLNSRASTRKLINALDRLSPDIIHIHNIHSHDCDIDRLFRYFKEKKTKIVWTFHDCWAFTGYCTYFSDASCDKWKSECGHCPLRSKYSWFFDRSREMHACKKELFSGLHLSIVTPSRWLASAVQESFLKDHPCRVIHNGIDLSVFQPTESNFRQENGLGAKYIVLGVAYDWGRRKGLDVFLELASRLPSEFAVVLVGTDQHIDRQLPSNILSVHRTYDRRELAAIYTAADVFVNPTRDEVLGLVNLEALASGTPVLTFDSGGSPECVDETCGSVINGGNVERLLQEIVRVCLNRPYTRENCIRRASTFDAQKVYAEYLKLYGELYP